jgi:hypothetical protein
MGAMRNIVISDVRATGVDTIGCSVTGLPEGAVENVSLENIRIRFAGGGSEKDAARKPAELPAAYPMGEMFGALPAYGFYCRHVRGLRMRNIDLSFEAADARPAVVADDVQALDIGDLKAQVMPGVERIVTREK